MRLPELKTIVVSSLVEPVQLARQLMQMIAGLREAVNRLLASPEALATYQEVELVAATEKQVGHKLDLREGQTPNGWLVTDIDANTTVRRNSWDHRIIAIQAANNCTITLKVW